MEISVKAARINAGYTQKGAANELNISKNTLASYENYRTIPDIDMAQRIATLYGMSVNSIKWSA